MFESCRPQAEDIVLEKYSMRRKHKAQLSWLLIRSEQGHEDLVQTLADQRP